MSWKLDLSKKEKDSKENDPGSYSTISIPSRPTTPPGPSSGNQPAFKTGLLTVCIFSGRGLSLLPGQPLPEVIQKQLGQLPQASCSTGNRKVLEGMQRKRAWWLPYAVLEFDKNEILVDAFGGKVSAPYWLYKACFDVSRTSDISVAAYLRTSVGSTGQENHEMSNDLLVARINFTPTFGADHVVDQWYTATTGSGEFHLQIAFKPSRADEPAYSLRHLYISGRTKKYVGHGIRPQQLCFEAVWIAFNMGILYSDHSDVFRIENDPVDEFGGLRGWCNSEEVMMMPEPLKLMLVDCLGGGNSADVLLGDGMVGMESKECERLAWFACKVGHKVDTLRDEFGVYKHLWAVGDGQGPIASTYGFYVWKAPGYASMGALILDYVEGQCGRDIGQAEKQGLRMVVKKAIEWLHGAGVVHGSIAWRNIMVVGERNEIVLIDFGRSVISSDPKLQEEDWQSFEDLGFMEDST